MTQIENTLGSAAALIIFVTLSLSSSVSAEAKTQQEIQTDAERKSDQGTTITRAEGPALRSAYGPQKLNMQLNADEAGTALTFSLGTGKSSAAISESKPGFYRVSRHSLIMKGSFPINTDNGGESPFTFGGIGNFEKVEAGYTYYSSLIGTGKGNAFIVDSALLKCANNALQAVKWQVLRGEFLEKLGSDFGTLQAREWLGGIGPLSDPKFTAMLTEVNKACPDLGDDAVFVRTHLGDRAAKAVKGSTFTDKPILFAGASGSVGRSMFEYVDTAAFVKNSTRKDAWMANAYFGLIGHKFRWSMRGQFTYLNKFEASPDGQFCKPVLISGTAPECLTGAIGSPAKIKSKLLSLELRKKLSFFGPANEPAPIAIAPQITYDFESKKYGIDVPVYLTANSEGKLTGGVRFGYRNDTKDFGASMFIGAPFKIAY